MIGDEVIYYLDTKIIENKEYEQCLLHLPEDRKEKAKKYIFDRDRKCCVYGYILVELGMIKEYGIKECLIFGYEKYGKPFLKNHQDICFNLSHSGYGVVCGVSNKAVGVDIQEIVPFDKNIGEMFLSKSEKDYIEFLKKPDISFTEIWSLKESYVKMLGIGIDTDLKIISFDPRKNNFYKYGKYFEKRIVDNYVISYCADAPLHFHKVTREELQTI